MSAERGTINLVRPDGTIEFITYDRFIHLYEKTHNIASFDVPHNPATINTANPNLTFAFEPDRLIFSFAVQKHHEWIFPVMELLAHNFTLTKEHHKAIATIQEHKQKIRYLAKSLKRSHWLWFGITALVIVAHMVLGYFEHAC